MILGEGTLVHDARNSDDALELADRRSATSQGICIGLLAGFDSQERPLVMVPEAEECALEPALSCVRLRPADMGRRVCLAFARGEPIVVGVLENVGEEARDSKPPEVACAIEIDGRTVALSAREKVTIKCGEASITLTRAGKVIINGTYVVSRSLGVNAIQGGAVEIN